MTIAVGRLSPGDIFEDPTTKRQYTLRSIDGAMVEVKEINSGRLYAWNTGAKVNITNEQWKIIQKIQEA